MPQAPQARSAHPLDGCPPPDAKRSSFELQISGYIPEHDGKDASPPRLRFAPQGRVGEFCVVLPNRSQRFYVSQACSVQAPLRRPCPVRVFLSRRYPASACGGYGVPVWFAWRRGEEEWVHTKTRRARRGCAGVRRSGIILILTNNPVIPAKAGTHLMRRRRRTMTLSRAR